MRVVRQREEAETEAEAQCAGQLGSAPSAPQAQETGQFALVPKAAAGQATEQPALASAVGPAASASEPAASAKPKAPPALGTGQHAQASGAASPKKKISVVAPPPPHPPLGIAPFPMATGTAGEPGTGQLGHETYAGTASKSGSAAATPPIAGPATCEPHDY